MTSLVLAIFGLSAAITMEVPLAEARAVPDPSDKNACPRSDFGGLGNPSGAPPTPTSSAPSHNLSPSATSYAGNVPLKVDSTAQPRPSIEDDVNAKLWADPEEGRDYVDETTPEDKGSVRISDIEAKFTTEQLKHMESLREEYVTATLVRRPAITRGVATHFISEIAKLREISAQDRATLHSVSSSPS